MAPGLVTRATLVPFDGLRGACQDGKRRVVMVADSRGIRGRGRAGSGHRKPLWSLLLWLFRRYPCFALFDWHAICILVRCRDGRFRWVGWSSARSHRDRCPGRMNHQPVAWAGSRAPGAGCRRLRRGVLREQSGDLPAVRFCGRTW